MSRFLKRLTINKALVHFPSLSQLYTKSFLFIFSLLRRIVSKSVPLMDYSAWPNDDNDAVFSSPSPSPSPSPTLSPSPFDYSILPPSFSDPGESIFLVPFRWWKEAVCGGGGFEGMDGVGGILYNATVQSDGGMDDEKDEEFFGDNRDKEISVGMRREGEAENSGKEGVSGVDDDDLALVSEWMFFTALKWHYDNEDVENSLPEEDSVHDLLIKLLCMRDASHLVIKISQKVNEDGVFNKACDIFSSKSVSFHIWDFSGQTNQLFVDDTKSSMDSGQPEEEARIKLKIYGFPSTMNDEDQNNGNNTVEYSWIDGPSYSSPLWLNDIGDEMNYSSRVMPAVGSGSYRTGALGLTGLYNLGNTCFMNSAIQCLVHTPKLVDYFLGNFRRDLNCENPLGMKGKLAIAFGDLLRKLWSPGARSVAPSMFKSTIASFAPQFSGYNQHDSQEFLSFLLDGLHEDLNRVKRKPYAQAKDEDGRPDEEVADEYWETHLSRNDSIIVDLCQGQYRSTLVCPVCKKLSITFDPFMYLSLPLPSSKVRKMTLTILNTDGTTLPRQVTIGVPIDGILKDLVEALGVACSLRDDETLLIAEVFNNKIFRVLDNLGESLELTRISDGDKLVAYRLPKDMDGSRLVVFSHEHEKQLLKKVGIPLVVRVSDFSRGSKLREQFLNVINPFLLAGDELLNDDALQKSAHEDELVDDADLDEVEISDNESENGCNFKFQLERGYYYFKSFSDRKIEMDKPVPVLSSDGLIYVIAYWPDKMIQKYDPSFLSMLPDVCQRTQDSTSLYKCVDAFLKEEPLGPEDMWYCPNCKEHRQANKKLDLWRLPEILVIHLKRFSYTKFSKNKLETLVDFPIDDLDLSNYVIKKNNSVCSRYKLFAVSNHHGGMGGGHYTAFAKHRHGRWFEFNDNQVTEVEEEIETHSAYVLFYERI